MRARSSPGSSSRRCRQAANGTGGIFEHGLGEIAEARQELAAPFDVLFEADLDTSISASARWLPDAA